MHRNLAGWFLTATALGTEHPRSPTCPLQVIPKFTSFHIQKMRILNVFNDICTLMYIWCIHIYSIHVRVRVCVCVCVCAYVVIHCLSILNRKRLYIPFRSHLSGSRSCRSWCSCSGVSDIYQATFPTIQSKVGHLSQ